MLVNSLNLNSSYYPKGTISNTVILGSRTSTYEFGGDTISSITPGTIYYLFV